MGIQDRDYYRNEGPSVFDSLMPSGLICRWLIGINVLAWVLQMVALTPPDQFGFRSSLVTDWLILDTAKVLEGQVWRLLTFAFLHDTNGVTHILFNMLFLWWFGSDVEQLYGRKEFVAIYLVSAFLGGVSFVAWHTAMNEPDAKCLGASGAVTTLLVLCALHFPNRLVLVFMLLPVPIWLFALFNIAHDVYGFLSGETQVAVIVHLAGAAFAVAYYQWQRSFVDMLRGFMFWQNLKPRSRLKIYSPELEKEEPVAVAAPILASRMDEHLEAKLDAILEKIKAKGKESLTAQEEEVLKRAAEMYKRRRT